MTSQTSPDPRDRTAQERADTARRTDEAILGGPRVYTLADLVAGTGLSTEFVENYWRWLGLPVTHPEEARFTAADMESLREIGTLIEEGQLDQQAQMTLVRSLGHTSDRLALWQVEAFVEHLGRRYALDDVSARLAAVDRIPGFADVLARQLEHAWRRQLAALMGRFATEFGSSNEARLPGDQLPLRRAIGFADIVSFTKRTAGLGSQELSEYVQLFESRARDVITEAGGRVVKTIGDAVLFVADDVATGAECALGLAAPHSTDEIPVRVGFVWGRVLSRFGDVFGPDVNLASRISELAEPATVLVDPPTAALLASSARYALTAQAPREVQGLGEITPVRLQRAYTG
ncbi:MULTISPECIES: adenylate/guanylate cyclase domain-containing protein [Isoptericola]|uniref:Adenylate/guanylate cyclase domain-containing protein n=1 Tax=Isoptericola sediminis TaxID=2733572 RepID=A0A849K3S8_9MICO|nr:MULTISPECIES: adenylate/guanylate cyclase domain-containing protein [unclassified Isoptericola]MDO8144369.1 adenylate/guanylate cyclase domain-containing protein [Isoptericola sp. 178]MDO8148223.1 adenylate/guanylate cyclase domain-containing protein [Isoptericola sp. b515]MDO8151700.1 adenylate/guanylate cyclase domain-containing protein [Isoptericola sp. b408]NNU27958.1 adenylate/guanylate cyclase domain-containing protein [Isoptericola sediminis]